MSWLIDAFEQKSEKNGLIHVRRWFGFWRVTVNGYDQSSYYIRKMWQGALEQLPRPFRAKQILLLGLGAGSVIRDLHKRFPGCQVTVIEWDPEMVTLAHRLNMFSLKQAPRILTGDACGILPTLTQRFDLIIFDLYCGERPEPRLAAPEFQGQLQRLLKYNGYMLVNVFKTPALLESTDQVFTRHLTWEYQFNTLALYRRAGYTTYRGIDGYLRRHADGKKNGFYIQTHAKQTGNLIPGLSWARGPIRFEGYFCDEEPMCDPESPRRLVIWQPSRANVPCPKGWWQFPLPVNVRRTGHVKISDPENYWKDWNENVRRQRTKWLKHQPLQIEEVTVEEFVNGYREARPWFQMRDVFVKQLRERITRFPGLVYMLGARDMKTGKIRAGFAMIDIPESKSSIHLTSFFHPRYGQAGVGTGLVDAWFRHGIAHGLRYMDFDIFWVFGDPRGWKGFSIFKSQFGTKFIDYPPPYLKIVGKKSVR
ncbi:MAG: hypothetical protein WCK01_00170 [Candidatus Uhrbacteria bacterium]